MENNNPTPIWQKGASEAGTTDSERYLAKLARRAFLNFWSYSNPYTDESGGSELCDFMIVFGNDIIIFSDKHCEFPRIDNCKVAWFRWYRSAIDKSSRQLAGASAFIERFPERIYLDSECKHPLPIPLPSSDKRRVHLVAVTRGSAEASARYWGNGSSSSLIINTSIEGRGHEDHPFMVGWPLKKRRFVHVLDELTLDVLLRELDTVSDFVSYLVKKEEYVSTKGVNFLITGEEELLASYLTHPSKDYKGFSFPPIPLDAKTIVIEEGAWRLISKTDAYSSWKKSNEISYEWDRLIEHQTSHIQGQTAEVIKKDKDSSVDMHAHEFVLRAMAEEGRAGRKILAEAHKSILTRDFSGERLAQTLVIPTRPSRAYVLLVLKPVPGQSYEEYRELRRASLVGYCRASRLRIKGIEEVVGIASEQLSSSEITQDFAFMGFENSITQEEKEKEIFFLRASGIWKDNWECV